MCGIAGIVALSNRGENGQQHAPVQMLQHMIDCLKHRGPDDEGSVVLHPPGMQVALGSTRLAIIDLTAAGHQPMEDKRSGSYITYNGEIYNYKEIRDSLTGYEWQSCTDTEVILRSYVDGKVDLLQKLRGMFSFAIWDGKKKELFAARDPFGIKTFYYHLSPDYFLFSSEVRSLLASGLVPRKISPNGLRTYLEYGSVESPNTIVQDVCTLEPGYFLRLTCEPDGLRLAKSDYASSFATAENVLESRQEACSVLRRKLEESVKAHLVSDVPVAAFLSGGIDSSAIVALMSKVSKERPRTVSIVFPEKEFSEEYYGRLVAERFQTEHVQIRFSESDLLKTLPFALTAMDQPTIDGINTYVISRSVRDLGLKVALSALGGDELFGGYASFRRAEKLKGLKVVPEPILRGLARAGSSILYGSVSQRKAWEMLAGGGTAENIYKVSRQLFNSREIRDLLLREGKEGTTYEPSESIENDSNDYFNLISSYELRGYMTNMLLRDTDFMSMAHGLEVRVPFIDKEVVQFVLNLPGRWKRDGSRPKPMLLDALGELIPPEIWNRPKKGFVFPFQRWMQLSLREELERTFRDTAAFERIGISSSVRKFWKLFLRNPQKERWSHPWALYVILKYCETNKLSIS